MFKIGDKAPYFSLKDQNGVEHKLTDYNGKWVLLYFYPKDHTTGCINEACSFRDNFSKLKDKVEIVGVSGDSEKSHQGFAKKYNLPFIILADPKKSTINDYGANAIIFTKRSSFLIDPSGVIKKIYNKVDPNNHAKQILTDVAQLNLNQNE